MCWPNRSVLNIGFRADDEDLTVNELVFADDWCTFRRCSRHWRDATIPEVGSKCVTTQFIEPLLGDMVQDDPVNMDEVVTELNVIQRNFSACVFLPCNAFMLCCTLASPSPVYAISLDLVNGVHVV